MAKTITRLSNRQLTTAIKKAQSEGKRSVSQGGVSGLIVEVSLSKPGVGSWYLSYKVANKRVKDKLGTFPTLSVEVAEEMARKRLALVLKGLEPRKVEEEAARQARLTQVNSFEAYCRKKIESFKASGKWSNMNKADKQLSRLSNYVFPLIGQRPIGEIKAKEIAEALNTPIRPLIRGKRVVKDLKDCKGVWLDSPTTAAEIFKTLNEIFKQAVAEELREASPMEAVKIIANQGTKVKANQKAKGGNMPSMPFEAISNFTERLLCERRTMGRMAVIFQIMTSARSGAVRGMTWDEVDLEAGVWTIQEGREGAKMYTTRSYPLTDRAVKLLKFIQENSGYIQRHDYVFISKSRQMLSDGTLNGVLKDIAVKMPELCLSDREGRIAVMHGFRSSFKTWAVETEKNNVDVELQLSHSLGDSVEQAYNRAQRMEQRRVLLNEWENLLFSKADLDNWRI